MFVAATHEKYQQNKEIVVHGVLNEGHMRCKQILTMRIFTDKVVVL